MPFAQLGDHRMHYYESGTGTRTVLLVHGFQASARIWQPTWERLPAAEYRCIAVDNRGAGESDAPADEGAYGVKPFADDLHALVQALELRDVVMVGHSMGGATAMHYAVEHPETLRALVLVDPAGPDGIAPEGADVEELVEARMAQRAAQSRTNGTGGEGIEAGPDLPAGFTEALAADIAAAPAQRLRGSYRSMLTLRLGAAVGLIPVPVLLIAGDADKLVPLPRILETYSKLPSGTGMHIWHGVGHSPNVETPDRFTRVLRRFIERTVPERVKSDGDRVSSHASNADE